MIFELDKKTADDLMSIDGEMKGVVFKTDEKFILNKGGEEKLKEVEEEIKSLGYSLKYREIGNFKFYPIGMRAISLLAIAKVFDLNEEQIKEMGSFAPKTSLVIKFFMQHFFSVKEVFDKASNIWEKHYMIGKMKPKEFDEKNKIVNLQLEEFNVHPILCIYLSGYFSKICEITINKPVKIEEIKCSFKGDPYHEYQIKW